MTEIIGFCNRKGGVGKTTTAINIAASLAVAEKRILLVDLDPQCNATTGLGLDKTSIKSTIYDIVSGEPSPVPTKTTLPFLDIIPSSPDLVGSEIELVEVNGREMRVREGLKAYLGRYDYIFIDGPPSLGLLTINLLTASSGVIIPVQCEFYALEGLSDLIGAIDLVRADLNPTLEVFGVLLTMFDSRNNLAHEVEAELRSHFKEKVFETVIPRSVKLSEAPSHGKPIILHDVHSKGAESYMRLAEEFLTRVEMKGAGEWKEGRSVGASPR